MHMVDPLFQRILVNECRNRNIPVIFDEVFTGFWRLGAEVCWWLTCLFSFPVPYLTLYLSTLCVCFFNQTKMYIFCWSPTDSCEPTWMCTRYSLFCKATYWWCHSFGGHLGFRRCFWFISWRLKGKLFGLLDVRAIIHVVLKWVLMLCIILLFHPQQIQYRLQYVIKIEEKVPDLFFLSYFWARNYLWIQSLLSKFSLTDNFVRICQIP